MVSIVMPGSVFSVNESMGSPSVFSAIVYTYHQQKRQIGEYFKLCDYVNLNVTVRLRDNIQKALFAGYNYQVIKVNSHIIDIHVTK